MADSSASSPIAQIGHTAGEVWRTLNEKGPMTLARLVKSIAQPRDNIMQAIGWLAREDKLIIEVNGRRRVIRLK